MVKRIFRKITSTLSDVSQISMSKQKDDCDRIYNKQSGQIQLKDLEGTKNYIQRAIIQDFFVTILSSRYMNLLLSIITYTFTWFFFALVYHYGLSSHGDYECHENWTFSKECVTCREVDVMIESQTSYLEKMNKVADDARARLNEEIFLTEVVLCGESND